MIRFTYLFIKILKKTRLLCTNSNSRDASTRMFLSTNYDDSTILHDSTQWLPQVSYVTSVKPHQKKNVLETGDATSRGSHWAQPRHGFADGAAEKRHQLVVIPLPGRVELAQVKKAYENL